MTILIVCTGNTCRSPMAEVILRNKLRQRGLKDIEVVSAGVATEDGFPAHPLAVGTCLNHGLKLNQHRSQQVTLNLVESAALIFGMSESHVNLLKQVYPQKAADIHLIKQYGRDSIPEDKTVADPIGTDFNRYETCFRELDCELERIAELLSEKK